MLGELDFLLLFWLLFFTVPIRNENEVRKRVWSE